MGTQERKNLSCTVPKTVADKLAIIAEYEGHLMSRKICKILTDYIKEVDKTHPALNDDSKNEN